MKYPLCTLAFVGACHMAPAHATNQVIWGLGKEPLSMIHIEELENDPEGCVAKVHFKNWELHSNFADNQWDLDLYDTIIHVELEVDIHGPDTMMVFPPEGYFAWPEFVVVPEDQSDFICIYKDMVVS